MSAVLDPGFWTDRAHRYEQVASAEIADSTRLGLLAGLAAMRFRLVAAVLSRPVSTPSRALQSAGVLIEQARRETDPEVAVMLHGAASGLVGWVRQQLPEVDQ